LEDDFNENHSAGADRYLLTYADLITLLLGLFIILYAISNVDSEKYKKFMGEAGIFFGTKEIIPSENNNSRLDLVGSKESLKARVENFIQEYNVQNNVKLTENERGFTISILNKILFESGQAQLSEEAKPILAKIAQILKTLPNDIRVEGNTDDVPINTPEFPSNWHLSIARATNTAYYLMKNQGLNQEKVAIVGNAEFKPVVKDSTEEARAQNRRVDIVILNK
jgi:chemotaxis protein MotB